MKRKKIVIIGLLGKKANLYYTIGLANACAQKHETYLVLPEHADTSSFSNKVKIITIKAPPTIIGTINNSLSLRHKEIIKEIKKINPEIIHFVWNHPFNIYYASKLKNYKIFWTCHDPEFHSGESFKIRTLGDLAVHKYFFSNADKIFVHGEKFKKYLVSKKINSNRIISIMHGALESATPYGDKKIKSDKNTFLFFGRIEKYKGLDTLLKAIPFVLEKHESAKLVIAGSGDLKSYKKLFASSIIRNLEIHNKFVSDPELADFFRRSSFVVLPYKDATQSGVVPVAYSFKKAVIATDVGALSDAVIDGKTGYLVERDDEVALAEKILIMLNNPKKTKQMGIYAHKWMKRELDWSRIVEKLY